MAGKRKTEAQRWFHQSYYDLKAAKWNFKGKFYNTVCFLSQQSAEKALKSLLYYSGARRKALLTHSLMEMVQEGSKKITQIKDLLEDARLLDLHYIPSRYPNGLPGGYPHQFYGKRVAKEALGAAEKIFTSIREYYQSEGETDIIQVD